MLPNKGQVQNAGKNFPKKNQWRWKQGRQEKGQRHNKGQGKTKTADSPQYAAKNNRKPDKYI